MVRIRHAPKSLRKQPKPDRPSQGELDRKQRSSSPEPPSKPSQIEDGADQIMDLAGEDRYLGLTIKGECAEYRIKKLIGKGGMGRVYLAEQVDNGEIIAIKVLPNATDETISRFSREGRALASLQEERVIRIIDIGVHATDVSKIPYLAMEYLNGIDLRGQLDIERTFSIRKTVDIALQCCEALASVHAHGIIHRDIKPGNIFLVNGNFVKLLDFGLAKMVGRHNTALTSTGSAIGTPEYMAPEQISDTSKVDARINDQTSIPLEL